MRGEAYGWLVRGIWPVAAWMWIAVTFALARALAAGLASQPSLALRAGRLAPIASAALVAALCLATVASGTLGDRRVARPVRTMSQLAASTVSALWSSKGVFLYPAFTAQETWALAVALDRAGISWTVDLDVAERRGYHDAVTVTVGADGVHAARRSGNRVLAQVRTGEPDVAATVDGNRLKPEEVA